MRFSKVGRMECPKGYIPIPLPASWRKMSENAYAIQPPKFKIAYQCRMTLQEFVEDLPERLMNLREIKSVCMSQLSKVHSNAFGLGLDLSDEELKRLHDSLTSSGSGCGSIDISSLHIFLFQLSPIKTRVS